MPPERKSGYVDILSLMQEINKKTDELRLNQELAKQSRQEIQVQMNRICADIESEKGTRARANERILGAISNLQDAVNGKDINDPGMKGRIKTLEDCENSRKWHLRAIWTGLIGAGLSWLR